MEAPQPPQSPRSNLQKPGRAPWVAGALVILAAAVGGYFWGRSRTEPAPVPPPGPAPAEAEAATGPAPVVPADRLRALLESLSADARYRAWLGEGEWIRRWAQVVDNLANGESPRKQLGFLAPAKPFAAATSGGKAVIAPASYQRYDGFADAVGTIDARAAAAAYRELHPALEAAWRGLGYPRGSLDKVVDRALRRIEAAPVREGDVPVVAGPGSIWLFADPKLEDLGPVEKHLLRMGPHNTRIVQAKARELREALR